MSLSILQHTQTDTAVKAVIYTRISSVAQGKKGHGLQSQETRCREFARMKGYEIAEVFSDNAVSGGIINRPGMQAMLSYINERASDADYVILIDDISRLARDIKAHLDLRDAIAGVGAKLESPSIEFGEDSDSILVENLLASVSQHQRQKNAEQTRNRMRARVMNGYWPFQACVGFKHEAVRGRGKMLKRDEPVASIIQEALEGYASGRFQLQAEVKRFLETQPDFPKAKGGVVLNEHVNRILTKPLYAGMVEAPKWGVSLRKGQHEGLISFETFEKIQKRLKEGVRAPTRADISTDFVLRGSVCCAECDHPMTSCWSTSKTGKKHPYYMCFKKGCTEYRKSIRRDQIESDFEELLTELRPRRSLLDVTLAMFRSAWDYRMNSGKTQAKAFKRNLEKIDRQIEQLLDRIVDTFSPSVIAAYEGRIAKLERERLVLEEKQLRIGKPRGAFDEVFERALRFLANPCKIWESGDFKQRKMVLQMAFNEHLAYSRKGGFRTPNTSLPFKALGAFTGNDRKMAETAGFEPA